MFSKPRLAATRARKLLAYDPETGALTWKASRGCAKPGKEAGTVWTNGRNSYRHVGIDGSYYLAPSALFLDLLRSLASRRHRPPGSEPA